MNKPLQLHLSNNIFFINKIQFYVYSETTQPNRNGRRYFFPAARCNVAEFIIKAAETTNKNVISLSTLKA